MAPFFQGVPECLTALDEGYAEARAGFAVQAGPVEKGRQFSNTAPRGGAEPNDDTTESIKPQRAGEPKC